MHDLLLVLLGIFLSAVFTYLLLSYFRSGNFGSNTLIDSYIALLVGVIIGATILAIFCFQGGFNRTYLLLFCVFIIIAVVLRFLIKEKVRKGNEKYAKMEIARHEADILKYEKLLDGATQASDIKLITNHISYTQREIDELSALYLTV